MHKSVISDLYVPFSAKLGIEAEDFLKDQRPVGLPLPPFFSILLGRCSSPVDIPQLLVELRDEYSQLRESLSLLEKTLLNSESIAERNEARAYIESIFYAVTNKFDRSRWTTLKGLVDFSNDMISPVADPTNPKSYKTSLLSKPVEWIRNWWLRRPLAQLFDLAREFREVPEYNRLAKKVFRINFSDTDIDSFKDSHLNLQKLFCMDKGS